MRLDVSLAAISVFSAIMLTYRWLSLHGVTDYVINFYAAMLVGSLAALILSRGG